MLLPMMSDDEVARSSRVENGNHCAENTTPEAQEHKNADRYSEMRSIIHTIVQNMRWSHGRVHGRGHGRGHRSSDKVVEAEKRYRCAEMRRKTPTVRQKFMIGTRKWQPLVRNATENAYRRAEKAGVPETACLGPAKNVLLASSL